MQWVYTNRDNTTLEAIESKHRGLSGIGKNIIKTMHKIWKVRCQRNLVRCQNTKQSLYYGPENKFMEKEYKEIVSDIVTKLTFENVNDLF